MRATPILSLTVLMAAFLQAQTTPTPVDCQFSATFTASSLVTPSYYNKGPTAPCIAWRLTYATVNATGVSISLQGTNNLPNGTADPAGWTNLTVTAPVANPATGVNAGTIAACCDYYPWVRAVAGTFTGTGQTMSLTVLGYKGTSASRNTGGGSGTVTAVTATSPIVSSGSTTPVISLDTTKVPQKFFGTAAPGSVATNLPGDLFTDTTAHNEYVCGAPSGTAAPACATVSAGGWLLVNQPGITPPVTFADIATPLAPPPASTRWYTKGGKLCSLSPAASETCTGGGGGGSVSVSTGPLASVPGSGTSTGDSYIATDYPSTLTWDGSNWQQLHASTFSPTVIANPSYTSNWGYQLGVATDWIPINSPNVTFSFGLYYWREPTSLPGLQWRFYLKSLPATPWTAQAKCLCTGDNTNSSVPMALSLKDSTGNPFEAIRFLMQFGARSIDVSTMTSVTDGGTPVVSANVTASTSYANQWMWFKVTDDGATRTWYYSLDGGTFTSLLAESDTTYLTANQFGIGLLNVQAVNTLDAVCVEAAAH